MRRLHEGDRAMIVNCVNRPELNGEITTVCSELSIIRDGVHGYQILLPPETGIRWAVQQCLRHYYDGDEPGVRDGVKRIWEPKPVKVDSGRVVEIAPGGVTVEIT